MGGGRTISAEDPLRGQACNTAPRADYRARYAWSTVGPNTVETFRNGNPVEVYQHNWHHVPASLSVEEQTQQLEPDELATHHYDPYSEKVSSQRC